jgi:hypothetical protein
MLEKLAHLLARRAGIGVTSKLARRAGICEAVKLVRKRQNSPVLSHANTSGL